MTSPIGYRPSSTVTFIIQNGVNPLICNSFVIGGFDSNPGLGVTNLFTGNIGHIVIYDAPASIVDVENVLRGWSNI